MTNSNQKDITVKLFPKQSTAFNYLTDKSTIRIGYGGAAGGGKSWLGCVWLIVMCLGYTNIRAFVCRRRINNLEKSTLVTFRKVLLSMGYQFETFCRYNKMTHTITFLTTGSAIDLVGAVELASDPDNDSFGSIEYTIGWFEEAHETPAGIYDTLSSRVGRHYNKENGIKGKILLTFNPGQSYVKEMFYEPYKMTGKMLHEIYDSEGKHLGDKVFIQAFYYDNPEIGEDYVNNLKLSPLAKMKRLLEGDWDYEEDPDQLIKYEHLEACIDNDFIDGEDYLGVDVNRGGNDSSCIARFRGNKLMPDMWVESVESTVQLADKVMIDYILKLNVNPNNIAIDTIGVGGGTADTLFKEGFPVYEFVSGGTPEEVACQLHEMSGSKHLRFYNIRAQAYWLFMEDVRDRKITFGTLSRELSQELLSIKYVISEKKIKIISKDDIRKALGRSPDRADAVVMANFMRHFSNGLSLGRRLVSDEVIKILDFESIDPFYNAILTTAGISVTNDNKYNLRLYKEPSRLLRDKHSQYVLAIYYNEKSLQWDFMGFNRNLSHIVCIGSIGGIAYTDMAKRLITLATVYLNTALMMFITKNGDIADTLTGMIMKDYRMIYNLYDDLLKVSTGKGQGNAINPGYILNLEGLRNAEESIASFIQSRELVELPRELVNSIKYYVKKEKVELKEITDSLVIMFGAISYYDATNELRMRDNTGVFGKTGQTTPLGGSIFDTQHIQHIQGG